MTNADWLNSRPETTAGTVLAAAEAWYAQTHAAADVETATLLGKLTAWLTAEHTEERQAECTLVTTLELTHVLRGAEADEVLRCGTAQRVADTMKLKVEKGLRLTCKPFLLPDHVSIGKVQVFGREPEPDLEGPDGGERPERELAALDADLEGA